MSSIFNKNHFIISSVFTNTDLSGNCAKSGKYDNCKVLNRLFKECPSG